MFTPPGENTVETKTCPISGQDFVVSDRDMKFFDQMAPQFAGEKFPFPTPTHAPVVRSQIRMAFRNELSLHHNKCIISGEDIISMYAPEDEYKVCKIEHWRGDSWSAFDTGRDFDFDRSFFEQFEELYRDTPCMGLYNSGTVENCDFTNWFGGKDGSRNCYLCTNGGRSEDCMYMR